MTQELSVGSTDSTFKVAISKEARDLAQLFWQHHRDRAKAKQVYLNTLAVFAVDRYLRQLEIETDWAASCSHDVVYQILMDVADLEIPDAGTLECRPVLPQADVVSIPPEVWSERIGYVAVQLDDSLQEATLLGFTMTVPESGEVAIAQLLPISQLVAYIQQNQPKVQPAKPSQVQLLSRWFQKQFDNGWQSLESLSTTHHPTLALRHGHTSQLHENSTKGVKLIDLGLQLGNQSLALVMIVMPDSDRQVATIIVQVHPKARENYLPPDIQLILLSESGETLQSAQSRHQDNYIQLRRFRCELGESFTIQVADGKIAVTEKFMSDDFC
ncbi:MAG: hypothetical protein CLLPBCKN_006745 [Chroococcidiopsis cubana SAG 39.79]|uniref:DUF1822 family protein n=1 Tax=Chroococcidiopsis cubana SAG 39.79 TaxID=388085 RepID=A0AB37UCM9_9CYAN|nr:DUF1822 family protein [Chroococcidiopsis cubana]MDZ4877310.1 hypothetical protein [Chroococcidiopsis cubana SAG 39.79]PSB62430.1 hypothetical protein C7B79_18070 [Chroococcidiopsis cubana CCALA 043]RUT05878.1 hypothetical protein DSM107010_54080 [Chroococcidiopsis cubana SAG 39.79]